MHLNRIEASKEPVHSILSMTLKEVISEGKGAAMVISDRFIGIIQSALITGIS